MHAEIISHTVMKRERSDLLTERIKVDYLLKLSLILKF